MSWNVSKTGRAKKLAQVLTFSDVGGCPKGSVEEAVKNQLGQIAAQLCENMIEDRVVRIDASGSAWNDGRGARSHTVSFKFETIGDFVE